MIIGAGLIGAHYAKLLLNKGENVIATVHDIEREQQTLERRIFNNNVPQCKESSFNDRRAIKYEIAKGNLTVLSLDLFEEGLEELLTPEISVDQIVNAINLGTLFGLKALEGKLTEQQVFGFCYRYNQALQTYARNSNISLKHLLVSTTGSGGIGLERMQISHNRDETGIPASIILKAKYAAEIRSHFRDFQRSSTGMVTHHAIVPASAVIDTLVYDGSVETYGDYKQLHGNQYMKAATPQVEINSRAIQNFSENGFLYARYGIFGEDGQHTATDLQQLQMFMGVTTATKIAEIIDNIFKGKGGYNYDVFNGGNNIPEQSEYAVHSFEQTFQRKDNGKYTPVTLSPIAPFQIALYCFAFELLADTGLKTIEQVKNRSTDEKSIKNLAAQIEQILQQEPERLIASSSLGVSYDLQNGEGSYKTKSPFERGVVTNQTLYDCIRITNEFDNARHNSPKLFEFMQGYERKQEILVKEVIGYLAAFPIAQQMRKEGHF